MRCQLDHRAQGFACRSANGEFLVEFYDQWLVRVGRRSEDALHEAGDAAAKAAAADDMISQVEDLFFKCLALAFAGVVEIIESAQNLRCQSGFLFAPIIRADGGDGCGSPFEFRCFAIAAMPAGDEGAQGVDDGLILFADGRPTEGMEKFLAGLICQHIAEDSGQDFIRHHGSSRAFE